MRPKVGRVVGQDAPEVVEGAVGVVVEAGEAPGDPRDEVVGLSSQGVGEVALGLVVAAEPVQGLGTGGQGGRVAMSQGNRVVEVRQGGGRIAELEADQGPVEAGREEVGVVGQGAVVGVAGLGQPVGRRQGQAAVQVRPGELGRQDRADAEVVRGHVITGLLVVAEPQGEPGPEALGIERHGAVKQGLRPIGLAASEQGGAQEGQVARRGRRPLPRRGRSSARAASVSPRAA